MKGYSRNMEILSAILLVFLALSGLSGIVNAVRFGFGILSILTSLFSAAGYVLIAVSMFRSKRDILALAGIGLVTLLALISFLSGFSGGILSILSRLLNLGSWAIIALIACSVILKQPQLSANQLALLPALLTAVYSVLNVVSTIINFLSYGFDFLLLLPTLIGTLIGAVLGVVVALLIPKWLLGEAAQGRKAAENDAAQKNAQLVYYYDLYVKGAITAEEYEAKRRQIEGF